MIYCNVQNLATRAMQTVPNNYLMFSQSEFSFSCHWSSMHMLSLTPSWPTPRGSVCFRPLPFTHAHMCTAVELLWKSRLAYLPCSHFQWTQASCVKKKKKRNAVGASWQITVSAPWRGFSEACVVFWFGFTCSEQTAADTLGPLAGSGRGHCFSFEWWDLTLSAHVQVQPQGVSHMTGCLWRFKTNETFGKQRSY